MSESRERTPAEKAYTRAYNARPEQKKKRAMRNKARREALRKGIVHKGDGLDIDHRVPLSAGGSSDFSNCRVRTQKENRGWRKGNKGADSYKPKSVK